ncbi:MAG: metallophosphoesterase [Candidatus Eremiobacteraeota bacterium]|nr:metallophosphoesterase [Candidatus Eremiobacteraeota bacterium]
MEDGAQDTAVTASQDTDTPKKMRKVVAIGDLHGDYFRLLRILEEQQLVIPGTTVWNPESDTVDLVLIGDYVDWRGEAMEGEQEEWPRGPWRILQTIKKLSRHVQELRERFPSFRSFVHLVLGNHDEMMLEALGVFEFITDEDLQFIMENPQQYCVIVKKYMKEKNLSYESAEIILRFLNWYVQGGEGTISSFGGVDAWRKAMEGEMGEFLRHTLRLGFVINGRLYSHSIPDKKEFWMPVDKVDELSSAVKFKAKEAFLWGRKVWGFDYYTGMRTKPFTNEELEEMMKLMGIKGFVVGHTPMHKLEPVIAYEGKVVNIDLHGMPKSEPFIEIYYPDGG